MKEQSSAVSQSATDKLEKPYASPTFDESAIDVESVISGAVLVGMMSFVFMLFIGCFDAGLIA